MNLALPAAVELSSDEAGARPASRNSPISAQQAKVGQRQNESMIPSIMKKVSSVAALSNSGLLNVPQSAKAAGPPS